MNKKEKSQKSQYIILPERVHKSVHVPSLMYAYPDLLVAKQTELDGRDYQAAHNELLQEDSFSLISRQFLDLLNMLKSGKAYDGNKKRINEKELLMIYNKITKPVSPWRAEWLGDSYVKINGVFKINGVLYRGYNNSILDGKIIATTLERLEDCVMENCFIDLDSFNYQGLPTKKSEKQIYQQGKNVYFWHPCDGSVARFWADSDGAYLNCNWGPTFASAGLGVRRAKFL